MVPISQGVAGAANNSAPTQGVTATSITVGGVVTASNAGGFTEADAATGAKAYFNYVNAHGGVYGRKIKFVGAQDDGLSSATDVQIVRQLVQTNHVFAVVPVNSIAFTAGGTYLAKNGVPFLGLGSSSPFCNTTKMASGFGVSGCTSPKLTPTTPVSGIIGQQLLQLAGGKNAKNKTAVLTFDSSEAGTVAVKSSSASITAGGMKVVKAIDDIPAQGASDFSPYINEIMTADQGGPPGAVYLVDAGSNVDSLRAGLKAAGFKGPILDAVSYGPETLSDATTKALLTGSYTYIPFNLYQANTAGVKQMRSNFAALKGKTFVPDEWGIYGYWAAAELVGMLKKVGPTLTQKGFVKAINSGYTYSLPGLFGATIWPGAHAGETNACSAIATIKNTTWATKIPLGCQKSVPYKTVAGSLTTVG